MPQLSPVEIAALAFALIVGLVLGYVGNFSGRKWRKRFQDERQFYAEYRNNTDAIHADKSRQIATLERQVSEFRAQSMNPVAREAPVSAAEAAPTAAPVPDIEPFAAVSFVDTPAPEAIAPPTAPPVPVPLTLVVDNSESVNHLSNAAANDAEDMYHAGTDTVPAASPMPGIGHNLGPSRLSRIRGIDGTLEARLNEAGIRTAEDIEKLSAEDEMALEKRLQLPAGHIALEQWRLQAALLDSGEEPLDPPMAVHAIAGHDDPHDHAPAMAALVHSPLHQMAVASEGAEAV